MFSHDEEQLNHVYHIQSASAEYMRLVVDLETGFRGFVLTLQPQFLQPYKAAKKRVLSVGQALLQMVKNDAVQVHRIERVQALVQRLMRDKDRLIARAKEGFPDEARTYIESGTGRALMLSIREEMARFDRREIDVLRKALYSSSQDRTVLMGVVIGGGAFALLLMFLPLHLIARSITGPLTELAKTVSTAPGGTIPEVTVLDREDEIGSLTQVMQSMNAQIRSHIQRIEQSEKELRVLNQSLAASEAKYRSIVDHAPIGIFTIQDDRIIFSSRENWKLAGLQAEEGRDPNILWQAIHPEDAPIVREAFALAAQQGKPFEKVFRFLHPTGMVIKVLSRATPIKNDTDHTIIYQGFNVDITALEQMRIQLNRAERLAALGQVAAGIAHEIRNPLVGIGSTTSLLLEDTSSDDPRRADLLTILQETRRLDRIVNQIVDYARTRELHPTRFAIKELLEESWALLKEPIERKHIAVTLSVSPPSLGLEADRDQLKQVFLNVIHNAIEAMEEGGSITIQVTQATREHSQGVAVHIQDTGKGIAPHDLPSIFDPFFTAGKRHGTGLGLALCRNIVEAHQGEISATSEIGVGTVVSIWLPSTLNSQSAS
ncbi:MAG: PAS domain S-box protein [Nitrospirae bacterium]|nr:MAG: PAS domain S-box protein [Nitrospirota bacterium]